MKMMLHVQIMGLFAVAAGMLTADLYASEKPKKPSAAEAEMIEAAEEDEAEQAQNTELLKRLFDGKVIIYPAEATAERPDVIGVFRCGSADYLIKLASPELLLQLKELDGKQATLNGKIRNKGKYFIVTGITRAGAAPLFTRRRGGI